MARKTIKILEAEIATLKGQLAATEQESKGGHDVGEMPGSWALLRASLTGHVPESADHEDLLDEATRLINLQDDQRSDADDILATVGDRSDADLTDALELYDNWQHYIGDEGQLHTAMWRAGVIGAGEDIWEALGRMTDT